MKYLLISGSPRKGNTEFILDEIYKAIDSEKDFILLREKNIKHCLGCLSCDKTNKCVIDDDMQEIYEKMKKADIFIVGTPNYFDNVPGLLKDFIDRTNPFYETDILKGKKVIFIVVGGGKIKNSERVVSQALKNFADCHDFKIVNSYIFQALKIGELKNNKKSLKIIGKIIKDLKLC